MHDDFGSLYLLPHSKVRQDPKLKPKDTLIVPGFAGGRSTMLKCKEFYPEDQRPALALHRKYEPVDSVLERINTWASSESIRVLNVETVTPCAWGQTKNPQIVRVWYDE